MFIKALEERSKELGRLIDYLEKEIPKYPEGNVRLAKNKNTYHYFHVNDNTDKKGIYIRKENEQLAYDLAQREYEEKLLREATREKRATDAYLRGMKGTKPEEVVEKMHKARRELIQPVILSDREYARRWQEEVYEGNPYHPEEKVYETRRGEMVRTKSEAMLADMYDEMGIPYRYEYPVRLYNGRVRYPDFTLLRLPGRKIIYHEHMGLLEEEEYRQNALQKLMDYARSGIHFGDNLLLTFETDYLPFNLRNMKALLGQFLYT